MPKYEVTYRDVITTHEKQTYTVEAETLTKALEAVQAGEAEVTTEHIGEFNRTTSNLPEVVKCDGDAYRFADVYTELNNLNRFHKEIET